MVGTPPPLKACQFGWIDGLRMRAHSTRGMASSRTWSSGVSIADICAEASFYQPGHPCSSGTGVVSIILTFHVNVSFNLILVHFGCEINCCSKLKVGKEKL